VEVWSDVVVVWSDVVVVWSDVVVVVESLQFSEFDFDEYVCVPETVEANTIRMPPFVAVKGEVMLIVKLTGLVLPSSEIVASLFWTFPAGAASDPLFAAR
jgi:hypothetical protein